MFEGDTSKWVEIQPVMVGAPVHSEWQRVREVKLHKKIWKVVFDTQKETSTSIQKNSSQLNAVRGMLICLSKSLTILILIMMVCWHPLISERQYVNMEDINLEEHLCTWLCVSLMLMMVVKYPLKNSWTWWQLSHVKKIQKKTFKEYSMILMSTIMGSYHLKILCQ